MIASGLCVFALGWGGGLLLGAFSEPDAPPTASRPQVVDADAYSPDKDPSDVAAPPESKPSSLLEQVFGLDDLEEERGAGPSARKPVEPGQSPSARPAPSVVLKEDPPSDTEASAEAVQLEETPAAEELAPPETKTDDSGLSNGAGEAVPAEAKPEKAVLPQNPYQ